MKIAIKKDFASPFGGGEYVVDLSRPFGGYESGDIVISGCPFGATELPLRLEIGIRKNGRLIFRSWKFSDENPYFHVVISSDPTLQQSETISGLFSGRIKFEGLKIEIGATIQDLCPIDVADEEKRLGEKIFLAGRH